MRSGASIERGDVSIPDPLAKIARSTPLHWRDSMDGMPVHSVHRVAHPWPIPLHLFNGEWAERNHRQSLKRLAERGGLSMCEALAIIERRPYERMPMGKAFDALMKLEGRPERFADGLIKPA